MSSRIRIGTRDSSLATWQAEHARSRLKEFGYDAELFFVKSEGDIDLTTPLTEMGGKGVFTKALDDALINGQIDIAVHSYKDLPTSNPLPLKVAAVMERGDPRDALVAPKGAGFLDDSSLPAVIATSSNRRRAQCLHRYPNHETAHIRGNVQTRLRKVSEGALDGAIFAAAGLKRVGLEHHITALLDWMVPAPAQGAIAIVVRDEDEEMGQLVTPLNHLETAFCTGLERELLNRMEAGCSAPVGAFAWMDNGELTLHAVALKTDGSIQYDIELTSAPSAATGLGVQAADALLSQGADKIVMDN